VRPAYAARVALAIAAIALLAAQPATQAPPAGAAPAPAFDISGYWTSPLHEDSMERGAGPEIADYGGYPLSEAGRLFALSYDPSRLTLRHHQCDGYVLPYQLRALGNSRAWEERDPHTHALVAIHWFSQTFEGKRTIWMDGRPHPPAYAPHTWMGFSTGRFVGNALEVRTTHLKQGWFSRNGLPQSDQATTVEFFVRHGDRLTNTIVVTDPVFLSEAFIRTTDFYRQPVDHQTWLFPCDDGEQILGRAPDDVPNYLFGENPFVGEYSQKYKLSPAGHLGGAATMYPAIEARLRTAGVKDGLDAMRPAAGPPVVSKAVNPEPTDGEIHTWPLRDSVYLLAGDGGNIVVQVGDEGAFVVDTGTGQLTTKTIAAIRNLTGKPIQFIANTSFHPDRTGGNIALRAAGVDPSLKGTFFSLQFRDAGGAATIIGHQNVQNRLTAAGMRTEGHPSDTYLEERRRKFHNGEAIELLWQPNAVTDGDSIVHFRRADVIVAGNVFTTTHYPFIDIANGGSVAGEIRALNEILNRTVYRHQEEGGTIVVPGHGYVSDEHEVVEYRDMVVIVRDRIRALIDKGATLAQVRAARPTADYDARYGATTGRWTTDMFVEAVYRSVRLQADQANQTGSRKPAK
jgi:glyoxylase-like metal-dependent hydrolase (beta-lactamase superfamily II)